MTHEIIAQKARYPCIALDVVQFSHSNSAIQGCVFALGLESAIDTGAVRLPKTKH